jgi:thiol-disulfide isomerase/thioredoxin
VVRSEPPEKPAQKTPTLRIGDPAPVLRASKWLTGSEVKGFEPGKVYVIEFWATWCGPCLGVMPQLAALQAEYKDKGLTVVGVTLKDDKNSAAAVEAFVAKRGQRYAYTFAFCEDRVTYDNFMTAAGLRGIPTAFVVGPTGKIEYIGHAMELDLVVPKVMAGTWRGQADIDTLQKEFGRFVGIEKKARTDPTAALDEFAAFEADHPKMTAGYFYRLKKLQFLLRAKKYDTARELSESLIKKASDPPNTILLNGIQMVWSIPLTNADKKYPELALKAAEAALELDGDQAPEALFNVAEAYAFLGDTAKAGEYGRKAVAAAEGAEKKEYEEQLKKLLDK